jgi:preprotein translocase subunit SecG
MKMETAMYVVLGISCVALVLLILIQQGKGAGVGFAMGGASQAMFGGSGGRDFFIKLTAGIALAFLAACMILGKMSINASSGQYEGAMKDAQAPAPAASPLMPATAAAPAAAQPVAPAPVAKPVVPAPMSQPAVPAPKH